MTSAQGHRHDDTAAPAREVDCPHCGGTGEVVTTFAADPNQWTETGKTMRQRCYVCHGAKKVDAGAEQ